MDRHTEKGDCFDDMVHDIHITCVTSQFRSINQLTVREMKCMKVFSLPCVVTFSWMIN